MEVAAMNARAIEATLAFYERVCFRKRSYSSLRKAYIARAKILVGHPKSRAAAHMAGCVAYRCPVCGFAHLGHPSPEKHAEASR
jgi:hypothetical protein